jgi:hypothetical protein|tara:strand:+ start:333 stop:560 length:228 start_codon:yes stop_codon:yes gene_type:complete
MNEKIELKRFTTLIQPKLLSKIKLISYFTNQKLNEVINSSLVDYIQNFENKSNTKIDTLIDFKLDFKDLDNKVKK